MTDDIRARHERVAWSGTPDTCSTCGTEWPCDAIRMADERDAAIAMAQETARLNIMARADAERLAEALRMLLATAKQYTVSQDQYGDDAYVTAMRNDSMKAARAALAAHDAREEP